MTATPAARTLPLSLQILSIVLFTFVVFLCVGMPLAVLPIFVHEQLGFGSVVAGLVISLPYVATLLARAWASGVSDRQGSKQAVLYGLVGCALSGALTWLATSVQDWPELTLLLLIPGRIALGVSQALIGTGAISWGIGRFGSEHAARVISINGICAYGGVAAGAPLGVVLVDGLGLWTLGCVTLGLGCLAWLGALTRPGSPVINGPRLAFRTVLWQILPKGLVLGLGSIGFGSLSTFITLYYAEQGWSHAALCLTLFGLSFIGARLLFADSIKRHGGYPVAVTCFCVETLGLALLWLAPNPWLALVGSGMAGFGLSLVYPALAVEILASIPDSSRSAALGAYALFFDLSLGLAGPLMGGVAGLWGYGSIFLAAALLAAVGLLMTLVMLYRNRQLRS